jgi:type II secretory pathway component PulC
MRFFLLIRTWIINILLAGAAVFFGYQTFEVWSVKEKREVDKPVQKPLKAHAVKRVAYRRIPRFKTYEVIPRKNLFSSDRREKWPEKSPTPALVKKPRALDHRFALYGIVINSNEKKALVSNLNKKNASEKEYIWVKVGDKIGDLNVSEITPGQIIISNGGSTYTVRLSDQSGPQKRAIMRKAIKRMGTLVKK